MPEQFQIDGQADSNNSGELTKVTFPYGGYQRWQGRECGGGGESGGIGCWSRIGWGGEEDGAEIACSRARLRFRSEPGA